METKPILVAVEIFIILYDCILIVRIVQDGNLPIKCLSVKLLKFPPLPPKVPPKMWILLREDQS